MDMKPQSFWKKKLHQSKWARQKVGKVSTNFAAAKNGKVGSNFSAVKNGQVSSSSKKR